MTKIDIFSGFLGAGKTTLIRKLIAEGYKGEKLVLIENEFGEIAVDGGFLRDAGVEITEMNSGCICCTLVGDFTAALQKVIDKYHPDRILIEPSGVGKLSDVAKAVASVPGCEIGAKVTVVDAGRCRMYIRNFGEFFNDQVHNADVIVLSRTDSAADGKVVTATAMLSQLNPNATVITTPWSELDGKQIVDVMEHIDSLSTTMQEMEHHDHNEHHHDHDHEDGEEEYGIGSFVYHRIRPFNQDKLQQFVEDWPKSVVRAKGVLWFDDKREDVYVFEQAGVQITATEQGKWLAAFPKKQQKLYLAEYPDMAEKWDEKYGDREIKLVFIGQHMDKHAIVDALDECLSD